MIRGVASLSIYLAFVMLLFILFAYYICIRPTCLVLYINSAGMAALLDSQANTLAGSIILATCGLSKTLFGVSTEYLPPIDCPRPEIKSPVATIICLQ